MANAGTLRSASSIAWRFCWLLGCADSAASVFELTMTTISASWHKPLLHTMADMQDEHNVLVHPQWREQGFEFYRAMWLECAEMLDHFG